MPLPVALQFLVSKDTTYFLGDPSVQSIFDHDFSLLPHAFVTTTARVVPKMNTTIHNEIW